MASFGQTQELDAVSNRLRAEVFALTAERDRLTARVAELEQRRELEDLAYVDATPDAGYVERILRAHLDANTSSTATDNLLGLPPSSPMCKAMNEAKDERARLLRDALDVRTALAASQADVRALVEALSDCATRLLDDCACASDAESANRARALLVRVKGGSNGQ